MRNCLKFTGVLFTLLIESIGSIKEIMMVKKAVASILFSIFMIMLFSACPRPPRHYYDPPPPKKMYRARAPHQTHIWVQGHWVWRSGSWIWANGYWQKPKRGYKWIPGHYENRGNRKVWIPGHWKRRR